MIVASALDSLNEGVRSLGQVCHLAILAPAAMGIIAARGRLPAVIGAVSGIVLGGWIYASQWIGVSDLRIQISAIAVIAALVAAMLIARFQGAAHTATDVATDVATDAATDTDGIGADSTTASPSPWWNSPSLLGISSAALALIVSHWWRPCVGVELGSILTNAPEDPWGELPATIGFMVGISLPLVAIGLVFAIAQPGRSAANRLSAAGGAAGVVLALSVLAGQHGEIVSRLFQWSQ